MLRFRMFQLGQRRIRRQAEFHLVTARDILSRIHQNHQEENQDLIIINSILSLLLFVSVFKVLKVFKSIIIDLQSSHHINICIVFE